MIFLFLYNCNGNCNFEKMWAKLQLRFAFNKFTKFITLNCLDSFPLTLYKTMVNIFVGSVVEWLKRRDCDRHGLNSKPTCAILLCLRKNYFTVLSSAWRCWQAVLIFSHISRKLKKQNKKFQLDSNIRKQSGNCSPYVLALPSCGSGG